MKAQTKYAPKSLNEVIYPSQAVQRRIQGYADGHLQGHIMLYGPNGTGKTGLARLLIQAIGGPDAQVETKSNGELLRMSDLTAYLRNATTFARITTSEKYFVLLNELDRERCDMSEFWKALDACGDGLMAIITTNEPLNIDRSLRSRVDLIDMPGFDAAHVLARVQEILRAEGLKLPDAQVLHYLKGKEHFKDLRKYFSVVDELLLLTNGGYSLPKWGQQRASLKVVNPTSSC